MKYPSLILASMALALLVGAHPVESSGGFVEMSPTVQFVAATPGSSIMLPYRVTNHGDDTYLACEEETLRYDAKKDLVQISPLQNNAHSPLLEPDTDCHTPTLLLTGDSLKGNLKITIPESIQSGEHVVLFSYTQAPLKEFATQSSIAIRDIASMQVVITVSRNPVIQGRVDIGLLVPDPALRIPLGKTSVYLAESMWLQTIRSSVENASTQSTTAYVEMMQKHPSGKIATLLETKTPLIMLPGMRRELSRHIKASFLPQSYTIIVRLSPYQRVDVQAQIHIVRFPFIASGVLMLTAGIGIVVLVRRRISPQL